MKGKREYKPETGLVIGLVFAQIQIAVTLYMWIKDKLRLRKAKEDTVISVPPGVEPTITDEVFEDELAHASASNGNGKLVDEPCEECEDEIETDHPDLSEIVEEPVAPVPSLPEEPETPGPVEPETPETDTP